MSDADLLAGVYLRACRREAVNALTNGNPAAATQAMMDRDEFLDQNPQYDDGTCREVET